jgi:hypothetical protein
MTISAETKLLSRYGNIYLTNADIGKEVICVYYDYIVNGTLIKINEPFEKGTFIKVRRSNDNDLRLILLTHAEIGFKVFRKDKIIQNHVSMMFKQLPKELTLHISQYI